ncbi:YbcC family protein [Fulvivirga sedimenti]|uniref:Probable inorganic carbon transporter subunit DabA n=1 Tax=Fulvivirga sedimenti TaxID=2879465 RepID=A0A9X1KYP2_9BACT|nr:DUF2309 domain-containing protein [Fulvivirga sedimenti]MCA6075040.1 DUF2309 domain-containing protein [Fulvivirga sedimenti]MCA6076217.1 DUF2309 domain-containing protein [Fulvivirga sedimenti]MCA6077345.1 DUF2309 domain-containing protein [Fulvivirga sedimenti]
MNKNNPEINNMSADSKNRKQLLETMRTAAKKIAPVWPLERFVAVNPYLGLTDNRFENVARDLAMAGGIQMTLPTAFYLQKMEEGKLSRQDIFEALNRHHNETSVDEFLDSAKQISEIHTFELIPTMADVAQKVTEKDWTRFMIARISTWAASYFDQGQAIWKAADQEKSPFAAWKLEASVDLTTEMSGLKGFRKAVKAFPENAVDAAQEALKTLNIPDDGKDIYLHSLLLRVGGWAAYAARVDWDNELYGGKDGVLIEFLAILLCWEACLLKCIPHKELESEWNTARKTLPFATIQKELNQQLTQKLILQEAYDLAAQREIVSKFNDSGEILKKSKEQAKAQAIFCIDVRSEVYRRNLEMADSDIETLGFAGFFAFPINYVPIGHETGEAQCPVLLKTGPTILEEMPDSETTQRALNNRVLYRQVKQAWKSFKSGAITCFSFVSPIGLSYLPKLFTDSFGLTRPVPHPDQDGLKSEFVKNKRVSLTASGHDHPTSGIPLDQQISMAKNALSAMSLTDDFARFVLIVGHGSTMVNNPHATGYDCGACGGHTGESNARVAAEVLNNREVRAGLQRENIFIPVNTVFLACLHDTTTDEVTIFNEYDVPSDRHAELSELKESLRNAGHGSRTERALRLASEDGLDADKSIMFRSKDWSQTRPEWGLAGCSAFVVAPRERTKGIDFGGRSFLHSYDWKNDKDFGVLELIMTAPMVVTSWISLQYYASTVDNRLFGSGNKTLHNVTAGVGVLEGYSGDLRVGLPWQAVHDGENFQHEPVRLNVIIEAPISAMNNVLEKHSAVKDLCDNGWINLLAMDETGSVSHRYRGELGWEEMNVHAA